MNTAPGSITVGESAKPGVTLTLSDEDFVLLASGKLDAQKVFHLCYYAGMSFHTQCNTMSCLFSYISGLYVRETKTEGKHYVGSKAAKFIQRKCQIIIQKG